MGLFLVVRLSFFKKISGIFNYANRAKLRKVSYILFLQPKCYTTLSMDTILMEFT